MSLRNRIGAAAGIAVALTVVSLAFTVYVAVRSELYNQVDRALNDRARPFATGSGCSAATTPRVTVPGYATTFTSSIWLVAISQRWKRCCGKGGGSQ